MIFALLFVICSCRTLHRCGSEGEDTDELKLGAQITALDKQIQEHIGKREFSESTRLEAKRQRLIRQMEEKFPGKTELPKPLDDLSLVRRMEVETEKATIAAQIIALEKEFRQRISNKEYHGLESLDIQKKELEEKKMTLEQRYPSQCTATDCEGSGSLYTGDRSISIADMGQPDILRYDEVRLDRVRLLCIGKVNPPPKGKGPGKKGASKGKDKKGKSKGGQDCQVVHIGDEEGRIICTSTQLTRPYAWINKK